jgi:hypothetical protein
MLLRPVWLLLLGTVFGGCRHSSDPAQAESSKWFDGALARLPRTEAHLVRTNSGAVVKTRDGVLLTRDHGFQKRNDVGCWVKQPNQWPGPGWRDVCAYRIVPARDLAGFGLEPEPLDPAMADQHQSEEWQANATTFGGRRAIVERARVSGGMEGAKRERRFAVLLELRRGEWARLNGRTGDEAGYLELLDIVTSLESP